MHAYQLYPLVFHTYLLAFFFEGLSVSARVYDLVPSLSKALRKRSLHEAAPAFSKRRPEPVPTLQRRTTWRSGYDSAVNAQHDQGIDALWERLRDTPLAHEVGVTKEQYAQRMRHSLSEYNPRHRPNFVSELRGRVLVPIGPEGPRNRLQQVIDEDTERLLQQSHPQEHHASLERHRTGRAAEQRARTRQRNAEEEARLRLTGTRETLQEVAFREQRQREYEQRNPHLPAPPAQRRPSRPRSRSDGELALKRADDPAHSPSLPQISANPFPRISSTYGPLEGGRQVRPRTERQTSPGARESSDEDAPMEERTGM